MIYTGSGGYALPFWKAGLYFKSQGLLEEASLNFKKASLCLEQNLALIGKQKTYGSPAFFISENGLLTLQYLVQRELN